MEIIMAGLLKVAKLCGGITVKGRDGKVTHYDRKGKIKKSKPSK